MTKKTLHITNGSVVTERLKTLQYKGEFLTWHEMLCEGPTTIKIDSDEFITTRESFLNQFYGLEYKKETFKAELDKLNDLSEIEDIVLWFEYDLFCHINMIAVISLLLQKEVKRPIYLVCSGRLENEKGLKGLGELNTAQLLNHYKNKVLLNDKDLLLAQQCWFIYNSKTHNDFKPYITQSSSFNYLTNCLKAHLKRFPDTRSGLSTLEFNILKLIKKEHINSLHHLLGYVLNYQGYYGFGDLQVQRIIKHLEPFYTIGENQIQLNRQGELVLAHLKNVREDVKNNMTYGAVSKYDFVFNKKKNELIKIF